MKEFWGSSIKGPRGRPRVKPVEFAKDETDKEVQYWIDQFRKGLINGLTPQDRAMIALNVTLCRHKEAGFEEKVKLLNRRFGIDIDLAERMVEKYDRA